MVVTFPDDAATTMTLSALEQAYGRTFDASDIIVVPEGATLVLDKSATLGGMVVQGRFTADDAADYELASEWVAVIDGGRFQLGSEDSPYLRDFTLTLTGDDPDQDVNISEILMQAGVMMSGDMMRGGEMILEDQDAFLMVMGEGSRLDLHGADAAKTSWTQLDGTAQAGATSFTLAEPTGWRAGDKIAIASTDFDLNQSEELTITSVSPDGRTVTFEPPLDYMHYGEVDRYDDPDGDRHDLDMRAEVALLSRNITIQGDVDYDPSQPLNAQEDQFGGHTMVMNGGEMYVSGVEFAYMGQAGILGKYPAHWHLSEDVSGQYIRDSSIHHSFNKGVTIHGTDNAEVTDNVVYETISHNYYFEDGSETGNVLTGNLGMNARMPGAFGEIRGANDDSPSNFYTSNADNDFTSNHAAGSEDRNYYFNLGSSDGRDFGVFEDNAAHSAAGRGFYLNHGGLIQDGNPSGSADQPQKVDPWVVDGLTLYKSNGAYVRGVEGTFTNSAFAEMDSNARFRLNQTIEDSLIVGRSNNIGSPQTPEEIAEGRSLPPGDGKYQGFQLYDGPGGVSNVMFDGFEGDDAAIDLSNAIHKTSSFFLKGVTWGENVDEAAKFEIGGGGNAIGNDSWARGLVDVDGSITGSPGAMIYQYSSDRDGSNFFNAGENYEVIEEWGAIVTYGQSSGTLRIDNGGSDAENNGNNHGDAAEDLSVVRSDGQYGTNLRKQIPVFSEYTYEIDYTSIDDQFRLYLHDMGWGQSVIFNLGPVPATSSFTIDDPYSSDAWAAREVSSMAMLEASPDTAVYRDGDGQVHIKLVAQMAHGYLWPQPGETYKNELHSGVTVLVDTTAGVDLNALDYDNPGPGDVLPPPPYADGQDQDHGSSRDAASDLDGDGTSDVLWFNPETRVIGQYAMEDGQARWAGVGKAGPGWTAKATGDFDGDGADDILWFNPTTGSVGQHAMKNGQARWEGLGKAGAGWEIAGTGDLNGDGTDDILWYNPTTGAVGQYAMADGEASWQAIGKGGAGWKVAGSGDFNGDGTDDILWFDPATGSVGQYVMNDGSASWSGIGRGQAGFNLAGIGDFNGDGADDILWFNPETGEIGQHVMGDGAARWDPITVAGPGWEVVATGDYDGNGTDDMLVVEKSTGVVGQYAMKNGDATFSQISKAGEAWQVISETTPEEDLGGF